MAKTAVLCVLLLGFCVLNAFSQSPDNAKTLCNRVAEIKELPFYDESGIDVNYDAIVGAGESVIPCLIEKIADTTVMTDPRCPRISTETKVGDVAFFVLVRITKIDFMVLFPSDVQKKYKTEGAYAYHKYIERKGKRKELQSKLRTWYRQKENTKT